MKLSIVYNFLISVLVGISTLYIAFFIADLGILDYSIDFYGIYTAIVSKGIFTILFIETVYRIKLILEYKKSIKKG